MAPKKIGGDVNRDPLPDPKIGLLMTADEAAVEYEEHVAEVDKRLAELSDYYQTPRGDYRALAFALAKNYVFRKRVGRPRKWNEISLGALYVEVNRLTESRKHEGVNSAVKFLAEQDRWRAFLEKSDAQGVQNDPASALRQRYYEAEKMSWSKLSWKAFKFDPDAWDRELDEVLTKSGPV